VAKEQYIKRNDGFCVQIHLNIRKENGVKLDIEHWYDHAPKLVERVREGDEIA
jgi:hypothetical protein